MHDILSFGISRHSDRATVSGYVHRAHVRDQAVNEFKDPKNRIQILGISLRFFATTKNPLRGIPNSNSRPRSRKTANLQENCFSILYIDTLTLPGASFTSSRPATTTDKSSVLIISTTRCIQTKPQPR